LFYNFISGLYLAFLLVIRNRFSPNSVLWDRDECIKFWGQKVKVKVQSHGRITYAGTISNLVSSYFPVTSYNATKNVCVRQPQNDTHNTLQHFNWHMAFAFILVCLSLNTGEHMCTYYVFC